MTIFNFFKKKQKVAPSNVFNYPRNEEGIKQVIAWLKTASNLIIDINGDGHISVGSMPDGKIFLYVYSDVSQRVPAYKKNDRFIALDFDGIAKLFEENIGIDFLWLNPNSDSVQLNRSVFSSHHVIKQNTKIHIGLPAERPEAIIDFLVDYAQIEPSISAIYLGLMNNNDEFSYVVFIDSERAKELVPEIGPKIGEICVSSKALYPVDFIYDNFLNEEQYQIYEKGTVNK
ncbi:enhanced serine sensitivity protein SseB C-terminal domain-containing protein [Enterococcus wangshanyuanii]|uniref:SseB protein C-terminal domain-containing protein n=1 Tax=Enterococcus wangshanyuanii TaxID=2005703 RepID=A0ABQ1P0Q6_9ENTE|nr:enhanced serine sensitivity protein SseB C-terminal domain-containing protein [Enterococcus wangshanyuanii]GGC86776.1 hypothetical protein GCM10011573_15600 [Enterococcus wangshanyuanii]